MNYSDNKVLRLYNFEDFGSGIMQNEAAQQSIFNNISDLFSISTN